MTTPDDRVDIALYGDDAEWFQELKQKITKQRDGHEPKNPEVVRLMMVQFDPEKSLGL